VELAPTAAEPAASTLAGLLWFVDLGGVPAALALGASQPCEVVSAPPAERLEVLPTNCLKASLDIG